MCNRCANLAGLVLCFIACFILFVIAPLQPWQSLYAVNRLQPASTEFNMIFFLIITIYRLLFSIFGLGLLDSSSIEWLNLKPYEIEFLLIFQIESAVVMYPSFARPGVLNFSSLTLK